MKCSWNRNVSRHWTIFVWSLINLNRSARVCHAAMWLPWVWHLGCQTALTDGLLDRGGMEHSPGGRAQGLFVREQPPRAVHRGNAPAPGSACAASGAAIAGCKGCCQTEMEFASEQMWGTSLPHFREQGPKLGIPHQLAVPAHGLSSNRRASPGPTWCWPQHRAGTSNTRGIQFGQPLLWWYVDPPWRRGILLRQLFRADCQACCESGYDFCGNKFCPRIYLEGNCSCHTWNLLETVLKYHPLLFLGMGDATVTHL